MANSNNLDLSARTMRVHRPNPAPQGEEWDGYRCATSAHIKGIRRERRHLNGGLRAWGQ